jgi:dynein heavy chain
MPLHDLPPPHSPAPLHQNVKWCVLDGDIDPEWIESLNTVMDDNKVLTLVSNERIPLTPAMRMVFEIAHLKYATPATVSRAGILFISERDIGWAPFMQTWIDSREDEKEKSTLTLMFNRYVKNNDVIEKVRREFRFVAPVSEIQLVQTICRSLEAFSDQIKSVRQV